MASSSKQQLIVGLVTGTLRNTELEYRSNVRFESKAALTAPKRDFWSAPNNGHRPTGSACLKGANRRHAQDYSITSSAVASNLSGTVMPIVLAVLRLITSSNLEGS